jgi:hypothetical protein
MAATGAAKKAQEAAEAACQAAFEAKEVYQRLQMISQHAQNAAFDAARAAAEAQIELNNLQLRERRMQERQRRHEKRRKQEEQARRRQENEARSREVKLIKDTKVERSEEDEDGEVEEENNQIGDSRRQGHNSTPSEGESEEDKRDLPTAKVADLDSFDRYTALIYRPDPARTQVPILDIPESPLAALPLPELLQQPRSQGAVTSH